MCQRQILGKIDGQWRCQKKKKKIDLGIRYAVWFCRAEKLIENGRMCKNLTHFSQHYLIWNQKHYICIVTFSLPSTISYAVAGSLQTPQCPGPIEMRHGFFRWSHYPLCTACSQIHNLQAATWEMSFIRPELFLAQKSISVSQINSAPAYRLVLTRFVMPASFALFKRQLEEEVGCDWLSPGVSHTDTVSDLRTHWRSVCHCCLVGWSRLGIFTP